MKKITLSILILISFLIHIVPSYANIAENNNSAPIKALVENYVADWNQHNVQSLSALFTTNVDFVTVTGTWLQGRKEFYSVHKKIHETTYKNSLMKATDFTLTYINPNLALVHWRWAIKGVKNPDNTEKPSYKGIFTWLVEKQQNIWLVRASQNTISPDS